MKTGKNWGLLGQTLALITLGVALAGCGGSSDAGSASSTDSTPAGASVASATPSVSGHFSPPDHPIGGAFLLRPAFSG